MENESHCNISGKEIQKRLFVGYLGVFLILVWLVILYIYKLPSYTVFPFAFMASIGFVQARSKYCVYVGILDMLKEPAKFKSEIYYVLKNILISITISLIFTIIVQLVAY